MRLPVPVLFISLLTLASCASRQREKLLAQRETQLRAKEQELLLRQKTLDFREQELDAQKTRIDSILARDSAKLKVDSLAVRDTIGIDSALLGNWAVRMTCTETTCPGSAVGDFKLEQWNLSYDGRRIVARASSRGNLVRTYSGPYTGNNIELNEHHDTLATDTRMIVRLRFLDNNKIDGQREIIRADDCKIVYALQFNKQRP
jgi:hypothetical protein